MKAQPKSKTSNQDGRKLIECNEIKKKIKTTKLSRNEMNSKQDKRKRK